jgi:hypothetical protein
MAIIPILLQLNMGGSDSGTPAVTGPAGKPNLMLLGIGRCIWYALVIELLRGALT